MTGGHPRRKKLPDTRGSITHKVEIDLFNELYITVGLYPDTGEPGEVFLTLGKVGSTMRGMLDLMGIGASYILQYGIDLDTLCRKWENTKFEPYGKTDNPDIPACTSLMDYAGKWLRWRFLGDGREVQVNPTAQGTAGETEAKEDSSKRPGHRARSRGGSKTS